MEKKEKTIRNLIILAVVGVIVILVLFLVIRKETPHPKAKQKEKKPPTEEIITEKEKKSEIKAEPIKVGRFGWKPVAKTSPVPGYIWEWAVEITNQTPLTLAVQITYELLDENNLVVGKAIGGENLEPKEGKIIIGRASTGPELENARKQRIKIKSSPVNGEWDFPTPYEIEVGAK